MSNPNLNVLPAAVVISGGKPIIVTKRDGSNENVSVRLIKVSEVQKYLELTPTLGAFVEFCTGKPAGWADDLGEDSLFRIDEEARKMNDPFIERWFRRQREIMGQLKKAESDVDSTK